MTSANVKRACDKAGLVTPCPGGKGCDSNDDQCTIVCDGYQCNTPINLCDNPMGSVAAAVTTGHAKKPKDIPEFNLVYAYRANTWQGSCGANGGVFCSNGIKVANMYAFCAKKK